MASQYKNVPNQPGIKYNSVSRTYLVYRIVKGEEQYQGKIKSLKEAIKVRDTFEKALPAETTAQTNRRTKTFSGKIDPKEIRKATTFFYKRGEISSPNYIELPNPQKDKVRTNVQKGHTPGKFSKINQFTPLSKSAQNKILKVFPDADFDSWKKGFDQTTDPVRFDSVDAFITRGYKPAFHNVKDLPKKTQDFIVEAFGKEAAAGGTPIRFGPGRKFGITPGENQVLNSRITNFLNNTGKAYPYAFSFEKPENWIIQQMARAADKKNPAYKVLKNEAGKIIGASENGVKYYHANSNESNLITNHPEAAKIVKFVNIARESKASIPQSLLKIFPQGFDQKLLSSNRAYTDLLRWLDNTEGRRVVANAINLHHAGEGSVAGSPALARDLQLLTAADNQRVEVIRNQILKNDLSGIPELKEKGLRLNVDGKEYGAGLETPEAGIKRIEKQAGLKLKEQLKIDPELEGFSKFLRQDVIGAFTKQVKENGGCPIIASGQASGGVTTQTCEDIIRQDPDGSAKKIIQAQGDSPKIGKLKGVAQRFLSIFPKLGTPGKIAAGAVAGAAAIGALTYNKELGEFVNPLNDDKASQATVTEWIKDNPVKTVAGTSIGFSTQEIPGAYKKARELGRGRVRSSLGITGALKPVLTTFGTPAMTALFEAPFAAKRLEEGETMTEVLTDPLGPTLGLSLMETLSQKAGVVRDAPKRTMLEGAKNYFNLSNVGTARPGVTSKILRMGMSPRMIAGASRFLGLPGLALSLGLTGYGAYKNYQNEEGMLYNLFNKDE